jgi:hypothetical protein
VRDRDADVARLDERGDQGEADREEAGGVLAGDVERRDSSALGERVGRRPRVWEGAPVLARVTSGGPVLVPS